MEKGGGGRGAEMGVREKKAHMMGDGRMVFGNATKV